MTDPLQVLGTTVAGKYDVVEFLFQRGARLAFRGLHRAWGEPVLIEFAVLDRSIDPQALETQRRALVRAGAVVARLGSRSTALPQARDGGTHPTALGELPYAVSEWIEGATVHAALDKARRSGRERFPPELVIDWFDPAMDALALAHGDGIVHGHIGPETLMVTGGAFGSRGLVKLTGFVDAAWRKTLPGGALPAVYPAHAYAAPELGSGDASLLGPWTDVYGLASVMVELIAGTTDRIALVTALPRELRHAFDKALATRIDERFKSVTAWRAALEDGVRSTESARHRNPRRTMVVSEALPELAGSAGVFESADAASLEPEVEKPRVRLALTQQAFLIPDALTQSDPSLPPVDPMTRSGDTMPAMPRPAPVRRSNTGGIVVLLIVLIVAVAGAMVLFMVTSCGEPTTEQAGAPAAPEPAKGPDASVLPDRSVPAREGEYNFSRDMFSDRVETWSKVLAPFVGKPDVRYLEVGVFEGRSVVWMLENVLTHPSAQVTAIDIFPEDLEQRFRANMRLTGRAESVTTLVGPSLDMLTTLPADSVDIAYVDGSHTADDVLADAVLVWRVLRTNGVLVFDDFLWVGRGGKQLLPVELRPSLAVAAFITTYRNTIEVLHNDYQVIVRKVENRCPSKHYCSPLDPKHVYLWRERRLVEVPSGAAVAVAPEDLDALEKLITSRAFGEVGFQTSVPEAASLVARLGLDLKAPVNPLADVDRANLLGVGRP